MAPSRRFAHYPPAQEAPDTAVRPTHLNNPTLRGWPLVAASALLCNSSLLSRYIWHNARFDSLRDLPGLQGIPKRFDPTVIPIAEDAAASAMLEIGPELFEPKAADLAGRFYSAADYHAAFRSGALTPLQVAEALLPLVQRGQSPPSKYELAWLETHADEVRAAAAASTDRFRAGRPLGILDGVPIGIKSDIPVQGYRTTMGMKVDESLSCFAPSTKTAWPVRKLMEAGAIVVGKNNMTELGMDTSGNNPTTGTPVNWFNKQYYTGGSSSGGSSALGAGLVPIALGTDAGGSARGPPALNGVFALKPSQSRTEVKDTTVTVTAPMAATVADLTVAYRIMSQPDPTDSVQGTFAVSRPPEPSAKKVIGICREWVDLADGDVKELFSKAIDHFSDKLGYEVVDINLPYLQEGRLAHACICMTEAMHAVRGRVPKSGDWARPLNYPSRMLMAAAQHTPAGDMMRFGQVREVIMRHLAFLWDKYPGLLIATPTVPRAGWKRHPGDEAYGVSDGNGTIRSMAFVWMGNLTGAPVVQCPVGYAEPEQGEGRLPVGLMAMGEWGAEEQLLAFARQSEAYLEAVYPGGRLRPQEWADVLGLARQQADKPQGSE